MSEFYLIRHGQASFGADNYDQLSEVGYQQSIWLGEHFRALGIGVDQIITGNMLRHKQTAEGIIQGLGRQDSTLIEHPGLNEFDFHNVVDAYLKQHPEQMPKDKSDVRPYFKILKNAMQCWLKNELDGDVRESWAQFEQRVHGALQYIQSQHSGQRLLVVSSGGAIAMSLKQILGYSDEMVLNINLQVLNSSLTRCFFGANSIRLASFNATPHLDTPGRQDAITYA